MWRIRYFAGLLFSRGAWLVESILINLGNRRPGKPEEELVLIRTDLLGDFIIWMNSAGRYRDLYPGYKITLLCSRGLEGLAQKTGYFDRVIPVDMARYGRNSNFGYRRRFRRRLKDIHARVLIQPMRSKRIHVDYLAASVSAECKICMDGDRINESRLIAGISERIYDRIIETGGGILMESVRSRIFLDMLRGGEGGEPALKVEDVRYRAKEKGGYFVLMPGASDRKKAWAAERFAALAEYIGGRTGWDCYVCGTQAEQDLFRLISGLAKGVRMFNYMGKTDVEGLISLIAGGRYLLGNDSAGMHIAVLVGTPSTCICGEWDYGKFYPYPEGSYRADVIHNYAVAGVGCRGCNFTGRRPECKKLNTDYAVYRCVEMVQAEQVRELVEEGLRGMGI